MEFDGIVITGKHGYAKAMEFDGIVITGAGIAGLATALSLHRVGLRSLVLERAECLRTSGNALGMWANAWKVLDVLGVADTLRQHHILLPSSKLVSLSDGATKNLPMDTRFHELRFVKRALLLETLASALPLDTIKFNCKVIRVRQLTSPDSKFPSEIELEDGSLVRAKGVIGCDGVNSVVTQSVLGLPPAVASGQCAVRGMATYPEGHHVQPMRQLYMAEAFLFGMIPVNDKEVYWFISSSSTPADISQIAKDPKRIREWGEDMVKDFPEEMRDMVKRTSSDHLDMTALRFRWPWSLLSGVLYKGTVTAAGDAMHPMTPYLAQGGCSALEDAIVLARCLSSTVSVAEAFKKYVDERKWRWIRLLSQSYITGIVQEGSNPFLRFIRDKIMLKITIPNPALWDCGSLPIVTQGEA